MTNVLQLTQDLINIPSVTPEGEQCLDHIINLLEPAGFKITRTTNGPATNLWARYGSQGPVICFLGHVDVVPPGLLGEWHHDPFNAMIKDGYLYGRGACDMKGGVAAMVCAALNFIKQHPDFTGSIALLLTTAEEDLDQYGVPTMVELLQQRGEQIDYCIVGEPSSTDTVGDVIRPGRRGSLNGALIVHGKQGHVAFPQFADNPIHRLLAPLAELAAHTWDEGSVDFPPTSLQISNLHAGTGVRNIIPGVANIHFNFRFSTAVTVEQLQKITQAILDKHGLHYTLDWHCSGLPFLTKQGKLIPTVINAVESFAGIKPILSTGGGTSDARFIAPLGTEVVELGVSNATAHKVNECVSINDLELLVAMYQKILTDLLVANSTAQ